MFSESVRGRAAHGRRSVSARRAARGGGNDIFSAIWFDLVDQGDILFTAAADARAGDATGALRVLVRHL